MWVPSHRLGRSPGEGHGKPLQYPCLESPMDRGAWWDRGVRGATKELDVTEQLNNNSQKQNQSVGWLGQRPLNKKIQTKMILNLLYIEYVLMCQWGVPGGSIQSRFTRSYKISQVFTGMTMISWDNSAQDNSVQFSSVAQLCPTLCDPMNRSTPGFPVHHQLPEFTQTHIHLVSDAIQPSHPLSSPSPAPNPSQHQSLFQWVNSSHEVAKVLEFQL